MTVVGVNQSKNTVTPNNADKYGVALWGDSTYTWGDLNAYWGTITSISNITNPTKNTISPVNSAKS